MRILFNELDQFIIKCTEAYRLSFEDTTFIDEGKTYNNIDKLALLLIYESDGMPVKEVAIRLNAPNSTVTSIINRLEKERMIKRSIHPVDKRTYLLKLTQKGEKITEKIISERRDFYGFLLNLLDSDEEKLYLLEVLRKMNKKVNDIDLNQVRRIRMNAIRKEYEEFGPWLVKVKSEENVPVAYQMYKDDILASEFAFKVPIDKEFRDVKEGMDLYQKVVTVDDVGIKIYALEGETIYVAKLDLKDIVFVQYLQNILYSEVLIQGEEHNLVFEFNAVSIDLIAEFVELIRGKLSQKEKMVIDLGQIDTEFTIDDYLYKNFIREDSKKEEIKLLFYQPNLTLKKEAIKLKKVDEKMDEILEASVVMTNGREIILLNHLKEVKEVDSADYGYKYTYIPAEFISAIECEKDEIHGDVDVIHFKVKNKEAWLRVGSDCPIDELKKWF